MKCVSKSYNLQLVFVSYFLRDELVFSYKQGVSHKPMIRQGRRFEKKPTRSTCLRVGHLYYYGTLFWGAKIFMGHFLLYDLKNMLKSPLMRP